VLLEWGADGMQFFWKMTPVCIIELVQNKCGKLPSKYGVFTIYVWSQDRYKKS
jgi:hypothetical protein